MSELYWLGVLGNLNELCEVTAVLCFFVLACLGIWVLMSIDDFE